MDDMTASEGLRARRRRETTEAIERSAVELVMRHGFDRVTVDMICEAAAISQRTFFNYAGSKERAVLGIGAPVPDDRRQDAYVEGLGGSPLRDLLVTMTEMFAAAGPDAHELASRRRQILEAHPDLAVGEFARLQSAQQVIVALIERRLASDAPDEPPAERTRRAGMVFSITLGTLHHLAQEWSHRGVPADPQAAIDDALALVRATAAE